MLMSFISFPEGMTLFTNIPENDKIWPNLQPYLSSLVQVSTGKVHLVSDKGLLIPLSIFAWPRHSQFIWFDWTNLKLQDKSNLQMLSQKGLSYVREFRHGQLLNTHAPEFPFLKWGGHLHTFVCLDIYIHGILRLYLSFYCIPLFKLYYPRPPSNSESFHCNPLVKEKPKTR